MLRDHGWDISRFVLAGDQFAAPEVVPACLHVDRGSAGYDGQFYYRLGIAPFSFETRAHGIEFDYPVYRQQRILYPLLAFVLAAGQPCAVLWSLALINVIAIAAIAAVAIMLLGDRGTWWSAVSVALWPGFIYSLARDLTEPLAMLLATLAIHMLVKRRFVPAALLLTAAGLARETSLLIPLSFLGLESFRSLSERRWPRHLWVGLIPIAAHVGWKLFLFAAWSLPVNFGAAIFAVPFSAPFRLLREALSHQDTVTAVEVLGLLVLGVVAALALRRSDADPLIRICWLAYAAMLWSLDPGIWIEDVAFMRAATEFGVVSLLLMASSVRAYRMAALLPILGWGLLTYDVILQR